MGVNYSSDNQIYLDEPWRWIELTLGVTKGEFTPPDALMQLLESLPRPVIPIPADAREPFWKILAQPNRAKGLRWLDEHGLLGELLPCWNGNDVRRERRLKSVEQIHLEVWRKGLSDSAISEIVDSHEVAVDGRLNRWALTALATLLSGGDTENQLSWTKMVRRDLHALGATEAEMIWVESIVSGINQALQFLQGDHEEAEITPALAVACLSTLHVRGRDELKNAAERADRALQA